MGIKVLTSIKNYVISVISQLDKIKEIVYNHNNSTDAHELIIPTKTSDLTNDSNFAVISSGTTVPSSIPARIGDIYVDTSLKHTYVAQGTASPFDWIKQNGSYTLTGQNTISSNPADSLTYYFGTPFIVLTDTSTRFKIKVPRSGVIKSAFLGFLNNASGSGETSSFYLRLNNTTDYLISSSIVNNNYYLEFQNTSLNIPVTAGDYFNFKWVTPTWATNPTGVNISATVLIDL